MSAVNGLSDEEIERLSKEPRIRLAEICRPAQEWLAANLELLEEQSPGAYLLVNVGDLTYAVGSNYDKAFEAYKKRFAIMPNPEGITFLGQRLSSKPR